MTVLIAAYNAALFLPSSLGSVFRQTYGDFEVLVIDDGSRDQTAEVVASFADPRLRFVRHETNAGLAARLNEGLELARGAYIARLDADDVAHPERLARQMAVLEAEPDLALLGANAVNTTETGMYTSGHYYPITEDEVLWFSCMDSPFNHSAVTYRRDVIWDALGGYDTSLQYCEDYDMWSRLLRAGYRARNLPDVLVAYRHHAASMTSRMPELRLRINVDTIAANLAFAFPGTPDAECRSLATAIAEINFGLRPCTAAFVRTLNGYFRRFLQARGIAPQVMRRLQATLYIRWGSCARSNSSGLALHFGLRAVLLSPGCLNLLVLPGFLRHLLARRQGLFWDASRTTPTVPSAGARRS